MLKLIFPFDISSRWNEISPMYFFNSLFVLWIASTSIPISELSASNLNMVERFPLDSSSISSLMWSTGRITFLFTIQT